MSHITMENREKKSEKKIDIKLNVTTTTTK